MAAALAAALPAQAGQAAKVKSMKIILLAEAAGESVNAQPGFANGAQMAVDELADKGFTVDYERITTPITPSAAEAAFLQAQDQDPDVIVGFVSTSQIIPFSAKIVQSGIPTLTFAASDLVLNGTPGGGPSLFIMRPLGSAIADVDLEYAAKDLKARKIFLYCVQNTFGIQGCDRVKSQISKYPKSEIVGEASGGITATDLTQQVLQIKDSGADAVLQFNFPNPTAVLANQLIENGVDLPVIDGASTGLAMASGAITGPAAENQFAVEDCLPTDSKNATVKKWVKRYDKLYPDTKPTYIDAEAYDAVNLAVKAAQDAGFGGARRDHRRAVDDHVPGHLQRVPRRQAQPDGVQRGPHGVRRRGHRDRRAVGGAAVRRPRHDHHDRPAHDCAGRLTPSG